MKPSQKHTRISPKNSALATFPSLATNAALRCEQRYHEAQPLHRKHKTQRWNGKCQALGITLKCFVMCKLECSNYTFQLLNCFW
ncbi:hypothetical protein F9H62_04150 [Vibrio alginolyticus]|nr:hypothetical protein [Vibrio alginolyticus]